MEKYSLSVLGLTHVARTDFYILETLAFLKCVTILIYYSQNSNNVLP